MEWDSKMTVAGKVNVANTMTLRDTNFENTGTVSANVINVVGSNFTSSGSILSSGLSAYENSNIVLGGSTSQKTEHREHYKILRQEQHPYGVLRPRRTIPRAENRDDFRKRLVL